MNYMITYIILIITISVTSCKIYSNEVFYCNDLLYFKSNKKLVSGEVYSKSEDGKLMSYTNYLKGIPYGKFEVFGYQGETLQKGFVKPLNASSINNLNSQFIKLYLIDFKEGNIPLRFLILKSNIEPLDSSLNLNIRLEIKKILFEETRDSTFNKIIIEKIKNDKNCPFENVL